MHAVNRRDHHVAGPADALQRAGWALAARLSRAPGFVSCAVLDVGAGVLASVSFFETEADLVAADQLVAAWGARHLDGLLPRPPQVTGGEVVVQRGL
jgi:hypothetical protein